jgi:DNA end-binding protein Ku
MAIRSMWKGNLAIGSVRIPVKLYAAVEDRDVHFHLLHDKDHVRVRQQMVNPSTGEVRQDGEIQKGFEVSPGTFVLVTEKELDALAPEATREVTLGAFVPAKAVGPEWYERPYFLGPDGKSEAYVALASVLAEKQRVGIARWVMRNREYRGALGSDGSHLTLVSLRSLDEVVQAPKVEPQKRAADDRETKMAEQLVSALAGDFEPKDFHDEYREKVRAFVEAKAHGRSVKKPRAPRKPPARSLESALAASLKHVNKERKSA